MNRLALALALAATGCAEPTVSEMHTEAAARGNLPALFVATRDYRRCVSPLCGGYWLSSVNEDTTKCKVGGSQPECYVATLDLSGTPDPVAAQNAAGLIVEGRLGGARFAGFGRLGTATATDAWTSIGLGFTDSVIYGAADNGIRCFTAPCPSTTLTTIGSGAQTDVTDLDFSALATDSAQDDAIWAAYNAGTLMIAGELSPTVMGGTALVVDEAWLPTR